MRVFQIQAKAVINYDTCQRECGFVLYNDNYMKLFPLNVKDMLFAYLWEFLKYIFNILLVTDYR